MSYEVTERFIPTDHILSLKCKWTDSECGKKKLAFQSVKEVHLKQKIE
jgi:hypothetical protein